MSSKHEALAESTEEDILTTTALETLPILLSRCTSIPMRTSVLTGNLYVAELLETQNPRRFHEVVRMLRPTFRLLLLKLQECGLTSSRHVNATEKLIISIYVFTGASNRAAQERFQHSGETISRILRDVLAVLGKLQPFYITQYTQDNTPSAINQEPKWYPSFSNCIGATDSTHVPAMVSTAIQARFRDRNGNISQNVFAACSFDMRFTHVVAGWEGSAHDGRVLEDAYNRGFQKQPRRYYLGYAGYALTPWVLTPYRGVRYHLKEFKKGKLKPMNMQELFNLRHASCRSVIERTFGVVKKRFPILNQMPAYPFKRQVCIVHAVFILHNFIRAHQGYRDTYDEYDDNQDECSDLRSRTTDLDTDELDETSDDPGVAAERDRIAEAMWESYDGYNGRGR